MSVKVLTVINRKDQKNTRDHLYFHLVLVLEEGKKSTASSDFSDENASNIENADFEVKGTLPVYSSANRIKPAITSC